VLNKKGFFNYMIKRDNGEPPQGRAAAGLLALKAVGAFDSERHAPVVEFVRKNIDKLASHHVPHIHLWLAANAFYELGGDDWKQFRSTYFEKLAGRFRDDGSVESAVEFNKKYMMEMWTDHHFGSPYATAATLLTLFVPAQKVRLLPRGREY
jgi:hypothetical protein